MSNYLLILDSTSTSGNGFIDFLVKLLVWYIFLDYSGPEIGVIGGIVVRAFTILLSYGLVGIIFGAFGCYSKNGMKALYHILSPLVSFGLTCVVYIFQNYIWVILIVLGSIFVIAVVLVLVVLLSDKKKKDKKDPDWD